MRSLFRSTSSGANKGENLPPPADTPRGSPSRGSLGSLFRSSKKGSRLNSDTLYTASPQENPTAAVPFPADAADSSTQVTGAGDSSASAITISAPNLIGSGSSSARESHVGGSGRLDSRKDNRPSEDESMSSDAELDRLADVAPGRNAPISIQKSHSPANGSGADDPLFNTEEVSRNELEASAQSPAAAPTNIRPTVGSEGVGSLLEAPEGGTAADVANLNLWSDPGSDPTIDLPTPPLGDSGGTPPAVGAAGAPPSPGITRQTSDLDSESVPHVAGDYGPQVGLSVPRTSTSPLSYLPVPFFPSRGFVI